MIVSWDDFVQGAAKNRKLQSALTSSNPVTDVQHIVLLKFEKCSNVQTILYIPNYEVSIEMSTPGICGD